MSREEVVFVTGTKEPLDESLTQEELDALSAMYDAIDQQGDLSSLDAATLATIEKIWIVRKNGGVLDPYLKSASVGTGVQPLSSGGGGLPDKAVKRNDYRPWDD